MGLMQLMPRRRAAYTRRATRTIPAANIEAGIKHLKSLLDRFGRVELALAAYNAGEARRQRRSAAFRRIRETRDYVSRILALVGISSRRCRSWHRSLVFPSDGSRWPSNVEAAASRDVAAGYNPQASADNVHADKPLRPNLPRAARPRQVA